MALTLYAEPAAFLAAAAPMLMADPVETTVIGAALLQLTGQPAREPGAGAGDWFATDTDTAGTVVGLAMRTGPYRPVVHGLPAEVAAELADRVLANGASPDGAQGCRASALAFAGRIADVQGGRVEVHREMRLHRLTTLQPPPGVPGGARPATEADLALLLAWHRAFAVEIGEDSPAPSSTPEERHAIETATRRERLDDTWLWVDAAGRRVSLAATRPAAFGVARIGPVYTPPEHRAHGYAGAVTAHLSGVLRDAGSDVVLFTDLANPTSNGIYRRIGFVPVSDRVSVRVRP